MEAKSAQKQVTIIIVTGARNRRCCTKSKKVSREELRVGGLETGLSHRRPLFDTKSQC